MMARKIPAFGLPMLLLVVGVLAPPVPAALSPDVRKELETSKYVYVASTRRDGTFGSPAEIWFLFHEGAVYVSSPTMTWRVRRIRAGRTAAEIHVGRRDGASFRAVGAIVSDPAIRGLLLTTFAKKYPEGWPSYEERFRKQLEDGSRVVIRYTPE
jgi:hypothetical protein